MMLGGMLAGHDESAGEVRRPFFLSLSYPPTYLFLSYSLPLLTHPPTSSIQIDGGDRGEALQAVLRHVLRHCHDQARGWGGRVPLLGRQDGPRPVPRARDRDRAGGLGGWFGGLFFVHSVRTTRGGLSGWVVWFVIQFILVLFIHPYLSSLLPYIGYFGRSSVYLHVRGCLQAQGTLEAHHVHPCHPAVEPGTWMFIPKKKRERGVGGWVGGEKKEWVADGTKVTDSRQLSLTKNTGLWRRPKAGAAATTEPAVVSRGGQICVGTRFPIRRRNRNEAGLGCGVGGEVMKHQLKGSKAKNATQSASFYTQLHTHSTTKATPPTTNDAVQQKGPPFHKLAKTHKIRPPRYVRVRREGKRRRAARTAGTSRACQATVVDPMPPSGRQSSRCFAAC